ncbi:zinc ribbon domain-containing protein [Alteromonas mediterranea]|uniref:zinc ribbon domain-containing protein n=1 Tax=Alteromonas mediterranea TaxID=314275 RepID=UPI0011316745|nr:zinc ribbon domain-containing protein [Alteromonas mediterranea]QDG39307.1 zinc ribbon domain-containing protein [Alteromonas mediterranea]
MNCPSCGTEQIQAGKYCSECGHKFIEGQCNYARTGEHSVNIGLNSSIDNSTINVHSSAIEDPSNIAYIERKSINPVSILGIHLKTTWLIYSGAVSVIGSFASIFSFWSFKSTWLLMLLPIGGFMLILGLVLKRHKFAHFTSFFNLEAGIDDRVYRSKIGGACPKCSGILKLRSIGPDGNKTNVVRCTRNPDHLWTFDPTVLDDL